MKNPFKTLKALPVKLGRLQNFVKMIVYLIRNQIQPPGHRQGESTKPKW